MRVVVGWMLAVLATGAGAAPAAVHRTPAANRAVFTADATRRTFSSVPAGWAFWTPESADVRAFEEKLPAFLRREMADDVDVEARSLWKVVHRFKRQYFGVVKNGRRVIESSFFCHVMDDRWRRERVEVFDGGLCYFRVTYDVERGEFSGLVVNAEA
jgi:hypothetical protein